MRDNKNIIWLMDINFFPIFVICQLRPWRWINKTVFLLFHYKRIIFFRRLSAEKSRARTRLRSWVRRTPTSSPALPPWAPSPSASRSRSRLSSNPAWSVCVQDAQLNLSSTRFLDEATEYNLPVLNATVRQRKKQISLHIIIILIKYLYCFIKIFFV